MAPRTARGAANRKSGVAAPRREHQAAGAERRRHGAAAAKAAAQAWLIGVEE